MSVFSLGGWRKGRGGCVRSIGHEHNFCQAQKAENTDPSTNYAVKYATAHGHLRDEDLPMVFFGGGGRLILILILSPDWHLRKMPRALRGIALMRKGGKRAM